MAIKIEKRVPLPKTHTTIVGGGKTKYPWTLMTKGDSIWDNKVVSIKGSLNQWKRKNADKNYSFTYAKEEQAGVAGLRVWRTA